MKVITYDLCLNEKQLNFIQQTSEEDYDREECLNTPEKIAYFMWDYLGMQMPAEEHMYMIAMNTRNVLLGIFEVSHGTANTTYVNTRGIFIRALLCGAVNIVIVHNHPSGNPTPSKQDLDITEKLVQAGKIIGIPILDHIIIGRFQYYRSLMEEKCITYGGEE